MTISNQCLTCIHYHPGDGCDAFAQIPLKIISGAFDHREPYPGDKGVRWAWMRPAARASTPVSGSAAV